MLKLSLKTTLLRGALTGENRCLVVQKDPFWAPYPHLYHGRPPKKGPFYDSQEIQHGDGLHNLKHQH